MVTEFPVSEEHECSRCGKSITVLKTYDGKGRFKSDCTDGDCPINKKMKEEQNGASIDIVFSETGN